MKLHSREDEGDGVVCIGRDIVGHEEELFIRKDLDLRNGKWVPNQKFQAFLTICWPGIDGVGTAAAEVEEGELPPTGPPYCGLARTTGVNRRATEKCIIKRWCVGALRNHLH